MSLEIREFFWLLSPPNTMTYESIITAVWASRGSKNFLIFLPAVEPWICKCGSSFSHVDLKVSKIQTSDNGSFWDSLLSTEESFESFYSFISASESGSIFVWRSFDFYYWLFGSPSFWSDLLESSLVWMIFFVSVSPPITTKYRFLYVTQVWLVLG